MNKNTYECPVCKKYTPSWKKYCSDKCRQKAYRERKGEGGKDRQKAARRANLTKDMTDREIICILCGKTVRSSVLALQNAKYCSDACKQAAYRRRKKEAVLRQKWTRVQGLTKWRMGDFAIAYHDGLYILSEGLCMYGQSSKGEYAMMELAEKIIERRETNASE